MMMLGWFLFLSILCKIQVYEKIVQKEAENDGSI